MVPSVLHVAFQRGLQLVFLLFRSPEFKELEIVVCVSWRCCAITLAGQHFGSRPMVPCGYVYWKGSHYARVRAFLDAAFAASVDET